jgi:hypothetical protein
MADEARYKDFDEAMANRLPIRFRIRGRDYELPASLKAGPVLKLMEKGVDLSMQDSREAAKFLKTMIGEQRLDQMLEDGLDVAELMMLAEWVGEQYGFVRQQAGGDGQSPPAQTPLSSSNIGET